LTARGKENHTTIAHERKDTRYLGALIQVQKKVTMERGDLGSDKVRHLTRVEGKGSQNGGWADSPKQNYQTITRRDPGKEKKRLWEGFVEIGVRKGREQGRRWGKAQAVRMGRRSGERLSGKGSFVRKVWTRIRRGKFALGGRRPIIAERGGT